MAIDTVHAATVGTYPDISLFVLEERNHLIHAQALGIAWMVVKADQPLAVAVEFQQSAAIRSQPQDSIPVLIDRYNASIQRAGGIGPTDGSRLAPIGGKPAGRPVDDG